MKFFSFKRIRHINTVKVIYFTLNMSENKYNLNK